VTKLGDDVKLLRDQRDRRSDETARLTRLVEAGETVEEVVARHDQMVKEAAAAEQRRATAEAELKRLQTECERASQTLKGLQAACEGEGGKLQEIRAEMATLKAALAQ